MSEHAERILAFMDEMYMESGEDDELVGGDVRDSPLTFGDIRWLRERLDNPCPVDFIGCPRAQSHGQ